ncbi:hypothetical protein GXW83_18390 [Streptacidiphilus sp. PB12-B1b]|uniref:hypothetical protein n=1 Tax=Streptacidiphilus sp. PB12-B1b TaxID=2705012 RepID=UPI0015FE7A11|nr:hypothetical protein [Streptacidiphilus sp. PB12-B1b]QMU77374.1 hypothetical protein GXW83_18390 [Streptacidiphilus sp. PB12-B1b]
MTDRFKRALALGAATVALAGGAVLTSVGSASAATPDHRAPVAHSRCHEARGYWTRTWHPARRDRHGKWHAGYWTRTWHPGHLVCTG